jgi:hypothetical protein
MPSKRSFSALLSEVAEAGFPNPYRAEWLLLKIYMGLRDPSTPILAGAENEKEEARKDGARWDRRREVRAGLIRMLCFSKAVQAYADPHGIRLNGAKITGDLDLAAISIPFPLLLENCYFDKKPFMFQAEIPELVLTRSWVPGLDAERISIKGNLILREFTSKNARVNVRSCHILGDLDCSGASFSNPDRMTKEGEWDEESGIALLGVGATIDGYAFFNGASGKPFISVGEVNLIGAQIKGDLDCVGGKFQHPPTAAFPKRGVALNAERTNVKGSVFLRKERESQGEVLFESQGEVRLLDAQIGGSLVCDGGHFENRYPPGGQAEPSALNFERVLVTGSARFVEVQVIGYFSMRDARLGGVLEMESANLKSATLDLSGASTTGLSDSGLRSWPRKADLKRFEYAAIVGGPEKAEVRLCWLGLQPPDHFNTESYAYLAKVLLQAGDEDGSRLVLKRLAELQAKRGHPFWYLRPAIWFEALIGYGYYPIRATWCILGLWLLGWIIYRRSYLAGSLVPSDKDAYLQLREKGKPPPYYPLLSSVMLSLENSLPLVKLGQADKWQPDPRRLWKETCSYPIEIEEAQSASGFPPQKYSRAQLFNPIRKICSRAATEMGLQPGPTGKSTKSPLSRAGTSPRFVRWFIWVQILLGWLFATLFVAGVTGLIRK